MADERTEQATPRRREEARQRGEVPRSAEVAGAAALLGALLGLRLCWSGVVEAAAETVRWAMRECGGWEPTVESAGRLILVGLFHGMRMAGPVSAGACVAAAAANLAQTKFLVSAQPLAFRWNRISLTQGLQRIFSRRSAFSVVRSLLKLAAVLLVSFLYLRGRSAAVLGLAQASLASAAGLCGELIWGLLIRVAGVLLVVAAVDYVFQRHEHEKNLRMTRHEVREEHKRTEGDPLVRSRIREQQRALARHRMLESVKKATVVVTNPVQFAVALKYETGKTAAPMVVAKGRRLMADRIRAEAERHGVPIMPSPDLARALYRSVPVGRQIPPELYQAVAEILAFVYRLTGRPVG
jgi:flagellar biosynthetic protein FlhB